MIFLAITIVYGLINLAVIWWFWRALQGTGMVQVCVCLVLFFCTLLFPICYRMPGTTVFHTFFVRVGAIWTGLYLYFFLMAVLADLVGLVARLGHFSFNLARPLTAVFMIGICTCIALAGCTNAARPGVKEFDLTVDHAGFTEKPLTIAVISDIHLGRLVPAKRLEQAVDLVLPHKPDLVLFLGDVLDDHYLLDREAMKRAVAKLDPPLGIWGIAGNHEYHAGEIEKSLAILEDCGIRILRDEWVILGKSLLLVGRDDRSKQRLSGSPRKSLEAILETFPGNPGEIPMILMDHQPFHLETAEKAGASLQLSGHTHYGQLWPYNYIVEKIYENPLGHMKRGRTHYLVSAGAGTWGPPMRTSSRPDVLVVRLH